PDITSFTVDNVNLHQSFDVHFTAVCPDAYCYGISVNDLSIQYPVTTDTTVTYDVPPCTDLTFTLYFKNCADETDAGCSTDLPYITDPVPDITSFTVDNVNLHQSFDVHFTAECPDAYCYEISANDVSIQYPVTTDTTVTYDVPPCTDLTFTLHAKNCADDSDAGYSRDLPYITDPVPDITSFIIDNINLHESFDLHYIAVCPNAYCYGISVNNINLQYPVTRDTRVNQWLPPCTELTFTLHALNCADESYAEYSTSLLPFHTSQAPDVYAFTVDNIILHESFDVHFIAECPDVYCYGISVNDVSIQYPVTTDTTVNYDVPPCTDLTFTLYAKNCADDSDTGYSTSLWPYHTDPAADITSFTVDSVNLQQSFDVHFTAACPDAYCYGISVNDVSIQYPVTTDTTVTYDVPPCTDLTFTLYAKNCADGSDAGYSTSLMPYHTDPVPDFTSFTVDNVNVHQSFDVHFTATCPDAYCFEISVNDVIVQYPVTTDTTVPYDVPLCSSSTFTLDVKNCADGSDAGFPTSLPPYPTAGQVDGLNVVPYSPLGSCYAYSSLHTTQGDAKTRCSRNSLKLIDSRNNLDAYKFFTTVGKAWVDLNYNGVSWTWGDGSTLLSNDALWEPGYPKLPTIRQCALVMKKTKQLRNGKCTRNLTATLCIQ
ncbi:uncharacterized protein LOC108665333, partial [Hyalella azteca]|uniref:Uncharacterized protein LOC108665333 n=1 Tax=Hyalella azteca TaxID=294128 RepID=A0A8B7N154_HYAAZ